MATHGGYRAPAKPAPVSGPGAHSQRTDGRQPIADLPDAAYGEDATFRELQKGAPLAQASPATAQGAGGIDLSSVIPMAASSGQPGTPVTDGADAGAGASSAALQLADSPDAIDAQHFRQYWPALQQIADDPNATPGTRAWVRSIFINS